MLPADAATLEFFYRSVPTPADGPALRFDGQARFGRGESGFGGQVVVRTDGAPLEIVNAQAVAGPASIALRDKDLNAVGASRLSLGGWAYQPVTGSDLRLRVNAPASGNVILQSGAQLRAPETLLIAPAMRSIVIEQGASINALGMGAAPYDARQGYQFGSGNNSIVAVSNGWLDFTSGVGEQAGRIELGACAAAACNGATQLYSDGTIVFGSNNLVLHDALRYGTRNPVSYTHLTLPTTPYV